MKEDLEKQVTNYINKKRKTLISFVFFFSIFNLTLIQAQNLDKYVEGKSYVIDSIIVKGLKTFSNQTVISYSGLRKGQKIQIPGEEISFVISKLWKLDLFSDINFYVKNVKDDKIDLEIEIEELPTLSDIKIKGLKKGKSETILSETELKKGKKLSESFLTNTENYIVNKFKKEGFLNTKVSLNTIPDSTEKNTLKMVVNVDKGERIKIKKISFAGNEVFSDKKLKTKLKNTKEKFLARVWKKSKFIEKEYIEDKDNLLGSLGTSAFSLDGSKRFYEKKTEKINKFREIGNEIGQILKTKSNNSYKR